MNVSAKHVLAVVLAAVLMLCLGAGAAFAYYTDTSKANGMIPFAYMSSDSPEGPGNPPDTPYEEPDPKTDLIEESSDGRKVISVANDGAVDTAVRVKLFYAETDEVSVTVAFQEDSLWKLHNDGWWYWAGVLAPGETTPSLTVTASLKDGVDELSRPFDIVVVQQPATGLVRSEEDECLGADFKDTRVLWTDLFPADEGDGENSEEGGADGSDAGDGQSE